MSQGIGARTLSESIREAESFDPTFASFQSYRMAAEQNKPISNARLLPQVNIQSSLSNIQQRREQSTQPPFSGAAETSQITVRQGLFRPRDWAGSSIGQLQSEYGAYKYFAAKTDLWSRVSQAWLELVLAEDSLKVQSELVNNLEKIYTQIQKQNIAGASSKDLEIEAFAQFQVAKAQQFDANQQLNAKRKTLQLLTGQDISNKKIFFPSADRLSRLNIVDMDRIYGYIMANPEVVMAQLALKVNEKKFQQTKHDHLPTVDAFGSYGKSRSDTINTLGQSYNTTQIGVQISIPLFSGGALSATGKQAAYTLQASKDELRATEYRIEQALTAEFYALKGLGERMRANQELVTSAEAQVRAAQLGIQAGLKSFADLGNAETAKARRLLDLKATKYAYLRNQLKILAFIDTEAEEWSRWLLDVDVLFKTN